MGKYFDPPGFAGINFFMEDEKRYKTAQKYHIFARELRGRILNSVAVIDTKMAEILTEYFCRNSFNKDLFFSEIAIRPSFGLEAKFDLILKILKKDFDFYIKDNPNMKSEFKKIREFRNKLAHAPIDVSDKALGEDQVKGVGFVIYKDGEMRIEFVTFEMAEDYQVKINTLSSNLKDILRFVKR